MGGRFLGMRELSLFTGTGGGLLGTLLLGWRPVGYVEVEEYCQKVIAQRIADGILPLAPIFGDVRAFLDFGYARAYQGMVDVVTGGFPCQPFSSAGRQRGKDDSRNMWPQTIEVIRQVRPRYAFLENVRGLVSKDYFQEILKDLAESGYDARWRVLSAAELGAPHQRDRLWIVAHTNRERQSQSQGSVEEFGRWVSNGSSNVADPPIERLEGQQWTQLQRSGVQLADSSSEMADSHGQHGIRRSKSQQSIGSKGRTWVKSSGSGSNVADTDSQRSLQSWPNGSQPPFTVPESCSYGGQWWATEPDVGRVVNGMAARVDRLKAIGNGQVPAVVRAAWQLLSGDYDESTCSTID